MLRLKQMSWDDRWQNYIEYGCGHTNISEVDRWNNYRKLNAPFMFQVISVMMQLKDKMSVYEAFLKALEIYYSSTTCGKKSYLKEYRGLQNKIYKDMKKGVVDEFLVDFHSVMIKASVKWCSNEPTN